MPTEAQRRKALKAVISAGEKEITRIISTRRRLISALITEYTSMPNYTKSATLRNKLYGELKSEYSALNTDVDTWTKANVTSTAKTFRKFAIADLPKGTKVGTFGEFSQKHLDDIIGSINPSTVDKKVAINARIGGMYDRDIQVLRKAVTQSIALGSVEGMTAQETAMDMMARVQADLKGFQFLDKAGRKWTADNYFGMLNRTLHATTARESYNAQATDAGFDLAIIEGGITAASLENPSDPCSRWAGKIISLTGATKGYPTYQDALNDGVWHPRCVHFTRVVLPSEIPEAQAEQAKTAKEGAKARAKENAERKEDGLKANKYAGEDGKV